MEEGEKNQFYVNCIWTINADLGTHAKLNMDEDFDVINDFSNGFKIKFYNRN